MRDGGRRRTAGFVIRAVAAVAGLAHCAWADGDPEAGHRLEQRWCSNCHATDTASSATDAAPSLSSIARTRSQDPSWLRAWLVAPHPRMPNFDLTNAEIDDIVAYLSRLAQQHQ